MNKLLLTSLLVAASTAAVAYPMHQHDSSTHYYCTGTNYTDNMSVNYRNTSASGAIPVTAHFNNDKVLNGVAMLNSDKRVLTIIFKNSALAPQYVATYYNYGQQLSGKWITIGGASSGTEQCQAR